MIPGMKRKSRRAPAVSKISGVHARVCNVRGRYPTGRSKESIEDEKETGRTREKERDTDGKKSGGKEGGVDAGRYHRSTAYRNSVCAARRRRWRPRPPPTGCYFVPSASERLNLLPKARER